MGTQVMAISFSGLTIDSLGQWVSLKIIVAEESEQSREFHVLQALIRCSEASLSSHNIVQLLDSFSHTGPNGCHPVPCF